MGKVAASLVQVALIVGLDSDETGSQVAGEVRFMTRGIGTTEVEVPMMSTQRSSQDKGGDHQVCEKSGQRRRQNSSKPLDQGRASSILGRAKPQSTKNVLPSLGIDRADPLSRDGGRQTESELLINET